MRKPDRTLASAQTQLASLATQSKNGSGNGNNHCDSGSVDNAEGCFALRGARHCACFCPSSVAAVLGKRALQLVATKLSFVLRVALFLYRCQLLQVVDFGTDDYDGVCGDAALRTLLAVVQFAIVIPLVLCKLLTLGEFQFSRLRTPLQLYATAIFQNRPPGAARGACALLTIIDCVLCHVSSESACVDIQGGKQRCKTATLLNSNANNNCYFELAP